MPIPVSDRAQEYCLDPAAQKCRNYEALQVSALNWETFYFVCSELIDGQYQH